MKYIFSLFILNLTFTYLSAQPIIEWQKCLGGLQSENGYSVVPTSDGGYFITGVSNSNNGDLTGNNGSLDYWVIKTDGFGNIQWQKNLGGSLQDWGFSGQQTIDGGFIIAGSTASMDGDVTLNHGNLDVWVLKLDSSGNIQWQKSYGGSGTDRAYKILQIPDGNYIFCGQTSSNDGDISGMIGGWDFLLMKIDTAGNIIWQKCLGGTGTETARAIELTSDGGYVVAGYSTSNDYDVTGNHGNNDYWVVKLDSAANILWQKSIGGSADDYAYGVKQTINNEYIIIGYSGSNDGNVTGNHGGNDYWVVKLDSIGNIQWEKSLGGSDFNDYAYTVDLDEDGGFIIGGRTNSNDGDVVGHHGGSGADVWVLKLDQNGIVQWKKCFGGSYSDVAEAIYVAPGGDIIFVGQTISNDGDVSGNHGTGDTWLVKLTGKYNNISGELFVDLNNDLLHNSNEEGIANTKIMEINSGRFTFSKQDGIYNLTIIDTGSFEVSPSSIPNFSTIPPQHSAYFSTYYLNDSLNNFAFQSLPTNNLCISLTPITPIRPGFNTTFNISYNNAGTTTLSPTIIFFKDTFLTYVSSSVLPVSIAGDSIVWNLPAISPFQQSNITLTLNVNSSTAIGTQVFCHARIEPIAGDVNPECNFTDRLQLFVTGSYDPNEILVSRGKLFTNEIMNPPYLDYVINFQNTGNDTAFTVKLINQLPLTLDASTVELVTLSHPADIQYNPQNRNLEFLFENILLPDSVINEPESHGFVHYKVKPLSTLTQGDTIKNSASIYFDFNAPIVTNTAKTTIENYSSAITASNYNLCSGDSTLLLLDNELQHLNTTWNWYSGSCTGALIASGNSITVSPTSTTTYFVQDSAGAIPSNNCFFKTITVNPPVDVTTTVNLNVITANATGAGYQWMDCDNNFLPIAGETNQSFTAIAGGNYAVMITENGCTDTSVCVPIIIIGEKEINDSNVFSLYPNPTTGIITIEFNNKEEREIETRDVLGNVILNSRTTELKSEINLSEKAKGVYFIKVTRGEDVSIIKIVYM